MCVFLSCALNVHSYKYFPLDLSKRNYYFSEVQILLKFLDRGNVSYGGPNISLQAQTPEIWVREKSKDCFKMAASPPAAAGAWILVQQASGVRKAKRKGKPQKIPYIKKGELLFEIPLKDRVKQEADKPPHNYALLRDPEVTLYDSGVNVVPLIGPEADYLEGVKDPHDRYLEHRKDDRMRWIMGLRIGEMVYFILERDKSSKVPLITQGRIKWYGVMDGETGVNFGIEITVSKIDCIQVS